MCGAVRVWCGGCKPLIVLSLYQAEQLKLITNALIDGDQSIVLFCMYIVLYNAYRRDQSVSYFRGLYDGII